MKKTLSFVLALAMLTGALAMTACNNEPATTTAGNKTTTAGKTTAKQPGKTEAPAETTEPPFIFSEPELTEHAEGEEAVKELVGSHINLMTDYYDRYSEISVNKGFEWGDDPANEALGSEAAPNLFDQNIETKWCGGDGDFEYTASVVWSMKQAVKATHYSITTANDNEEYIGRNMVSWRIYATNKDLDESMQMNKELFDSDEVPEGWELVAKVADSKLPDLNYTECGFAMDKVGSYKHFMLLIDAVDHTDNCTQMCEFTLYGDAD